MYKVCVPQDQSTPHISRHRGFLVTQGGTLLEEIKVLESQQHKQRTAVWCPRSKAERRFRTPWKRAIERSIRPLHSVTLDEKTKQTLETDINKFLLPTTAQWYAERGIPWRRGYIFYGPPGTRKTSLALALAGIFGLGVYILSLVNPEIEDSDLIEFFNGVPQRCIVLLEDIDAAGLLKTRPTSHTKDEESGGITLSGLLNAIDGIASQEGRVLVMTTNLLEVLDEALIRPGRIDVRIKFTLATKDQMRNMFIRMYGNELHGINEMADRFAASIPEHTFSPADIQSYLILKRMDPHQALEHIDTWTCKRLQGEISIDQD